MSLKVNADYDFGPTRMLFQMRNDDLTEATPDNTIGGVGPFDFSGEADPSAIPMIFKTDNGAAQSIDLDFVTPAVVDIAAVTVAEVFAAINAETPTNVTASAEAVTGRLKIVVSGSTLDRFQVYGVAAEISMIGQGYTTRIVITNTMKSFVTTPTLKDDETFTTTDAEGDDTEVIIPGYRKGVTGTWIDSANDYLLRRIHEGGTIDATTEEYSSPNVNTEKGMFVVEVYRAKYTHGTNHKKELSGYTKQTIENATGTFAERTFELGLSDANYGYTGTAPKLSGVIGSDLKELPLTIAAYQALDLDNVAA